MLTHVLDAIRTFMHKDGAVLLPELELLLFALGILAMDVWITQRERFWSPALALAGTVFSGLTLWMLRTRILQSGDLIGIHESVIADSYFVFFSALFLVATALVILLSLNSPATTAVNQGRHYALLLFACMSMMLMISSVDLLVIFLTLEAAAVSSYFLAATPGFSAKPDPGAAKYFLKSALGSAIVAYGFSLAYGLTASTNIGKVATGLDRRHNLANVLASSRHPDAQGAQLQQLLQTRLPEALHWHPWMLQALPIAAFTLVFIGLLIKLKALPAHHWSRIANSTAPLTVTLYLGGAFVIATIALFLRMSLTVFADSQTTWWYVIVAFSVVIIVVGTIKCFASSNLERLVTYSIPVHVGYLFLGLVAADEAALTAMTYYLFAYLFMLTGTFTVLLALRRGAHHNSEQRNTVENLLDLPGLRRRSPITALLLIVFVLSLAGFPSTAGFYWRYSFFRALSETGHHVLAWFTVVAAVPLAGAYLRIVIYAWRNNTSKPQTETAPVSFGVAEAIVLGICLFVSLAAGLYSEPFTRVARYAFGP